MKWKDHRRLISAATQLHNVPPSTYKGLMDGVIYPDKTNSWRKEKGKRLESHHHPDKDKIVKLIWKARKHWLKGKEKDAGFHLGRALHYIHDGCVSKGFIGMSHGVNENIIHSLDLHENVFDSGIQNSRSDPFFIRKLVWQVTPQSPEKAIDNASYATASLIKAVLNYQAIPPELAEDYKNACIRHTKYLQTGIGICLAIILLAIFTNSMRLILFSPVLGFIVVKMDNGYYQTKKKWNWFNKEI